MWRSTPKSAKIRGSWRYEREYNNNRRLRRKWRFLPKNGNFGRFEGDTRSVLVLVAINLNYYDDENVMLQRGSWCYREDSYTCRRNLTCVDSCFKYGRFYTWAAAIDSVGLGRTCGYNGGVCTFSGNVKGLCPDGWHLPDTTEWTNLKVAAKSSMALQSMGFEKWDKATNESGFSMVPIGYYKSPESAYESGSFSQVGNYAWFWTASDALAEISWYAYAVSSSFGLSKSDGAGVYTKRDGFSIRCVKD